jgi:O-antigen/teichoic acid export membrane protein
MAHILVKNLSVNVFGQIVNIVGQVVLLPLFLHTWQVRLYGEWLVLLALPTYFSPLADVGITNVAANDMTIQFAKDHRHQVLEVFQSVWLFVTILSSLVAILVAAMTLGFTNALQLSVMSGERLMSSCMLGIFFVSFQQEIVQAGCVRSGELLKAISQYT